MSYAEERVYKAKVLVKFAEEGFRKSVDEVAKQIFDVSIDDVPKMLEALMLEYEALKDVRKDLDYAKKHLAESEVK
jgi:hypothetical protein